MNAPHSIAGSSRGGASGCTVDAYLSLYPLSMYLRLMVQIRFAVPWPAKPTADDMMPMRKPWLTNAHARYVVV